MFVCSDKNGKSLEYEKLEKFNLESRWVCVGMGVLGVCGCWGRGDHYYRGYYVIGESRLNFSRSSYSISPATHTKNFD